MSKRSYSDIHEEDALYFNKKPRLAKTVVEPEPPVNNNGNEILDFLGGGESVMIKNNHISFNWNRSSNRAIIVSVLSRPNICSCFFPQIILN